MGRGGVAWVSVAAAVSLVLSGTSTGAAQPLAVRVCAAAWTVAPQPAPAGSGGLNGVDASSSTDAWSVGSLYDPSDQKGHTLRRQVVRCR